MESLPHPLSPASHQFWGQGASPLDPAHSSH